MALPPLQRIELPILAPIPAGHDVLVATLRLPDENLRTQWLVFDQTDRVLYCDERLWGPLGAGEQVMADPVGVLTRQKWVVERQILERVSGSMVTMATGQESTTLRTRFFLEHGSPPPYR